MGVRPREREIDGVSLTCDFELPLSADICNDQREGNFILAESWEISHDLFQVLYSLGEEFLVY